MVASFQLFIMIVCCRDDDMQSMVSVLNTDRSYDIGNVADIDDDDEGHSSIVGEGDTSACISELAAQIEAFSHDVSNDGK